MKINNNLIVFKSHPGPFVDERDGIKPNTVRLLTPVEAEQVEEKWGCIDFIIIKKSTGEEQFKRVLRNISDVTESMGEQFKNQIFPNRLYVFSWDIDTPERVLVEKRGVGIVE